METVGGEDSSIADLIAIPYVVLHYVRLMIVGVANYKLLPLHHLCR